MNARTVLAVGVAVLAILMIALRAYAQSHTGMSNAQADVADANGNLHVPPDYRSAYEFLGTWAVAPSQGQDVKELHVVYASPGTARAYREKGRFPDGAVLVKEVRETATRQMSTGIVTHAETLKGWFVLLKDDRGRYPANKLWGDGWGWSWFDAANPLKTTSTDYKANCLGCHVPAQATAWVYVDGYPAMKK